MMINLERFANKIILPRWGLLNMLKSRQRTSLIIVIAFWGWFILPGLARAADYALSFDGVDDYVEVPSSDNLLFGDGDFSVELWIKTSSNLYADWVCKMKPDYTGVGWDIYPGETWIYFWITDGLNESYLNKEVNYYDNGWHHIVGMRNGTKIEIYFDGIFGTDKDASSVGSTDNVDNLTLSYPEHLRGLIDEVRIYNRALSENEVLEHYNDVYNNETGLVGLWSFDEMEGSVAHDSSGYGNHGTIYGTTWTDARPVPAPAASPAYKPIVEIKSPQRGDRFSEFVEIEYEATDENNIVGPSQFALGDDAVSIFYSEDGGESWILIAKGLPPIGSYQWDVSDLKEGNFYQIKVLAKDRSKEKDEEISEGFIIDKTPPLFDISVEPPFSRGENVVITIQTTEPLLDPPEVIVLQRDYTDIAVPVYGEDVLWEGTYQVKPGFDGTAKINITGKDLAGNISDIIRKGGLFHVGIRPPPTPIVISPLDNDIVDTPFISVVGNVREDTKAVLLLNNEEVEEVDPDSEGNFVIENIELSKTFNKGVNILQIISKDPGGNLSEPVSLSIKFNVLPTLQILEPQAEDILFETSTIKIFSTDENADKLTFSIEASVDGGEEWYVLVDDLKVQVFVWNTPEFPDGEYILRVTANDGFEEIVVTSEKFLLHNCLPVISFEKERTIINKDSLEITGLAEIRLGGPRVVKKNITDVEYSLDQGETWLQAQAKDGRFDSLSEEFVISLTNLKERLYEILVRARDTMDLVGKAKIILIVDFGLPPEPTVNFPEVKEIFGNREDLALDKAGIQIRIGGEAEPDNQIMVTNGSLIFEGLSDSQGVFDMEVTLREHGENILKISAIDPAGNKSETEASLVVIKNNPPNLKFFWPRINGGINHLAEIVFEIQDPDLDPIKESTLSYRKLEEESKIILARNLKDNTFSWDVSHFPEGFYELILEASDGVSKNMITREFFIDNTPPTVSFEPLEKSAFNQSFILVVTGGAQDDFSGVEYVEYSIDSENWFKALITSGYKEKTATFQVKHPFELEDGTYQLTFRATDVSGNVSELSESQEIIVDTTPPRIGSYTLSVGTIVLLPEEEVFGVLEGTKIKFIISLEGDTKEANLFVGNQEIELVKRIGLWEGEISLSGTGEYKILIWAEDFLENKTENKEIGTIKSISKGKVLSLEDNPIKGVKMSIFVFNEENQSWVRWQGEAYDLVNPLFTDKSGEYQLLLPPGKYQILLQKSGFKRLKSSSFEFLFPRFITFDFKLEPRSGLRGFFEDLIEKVSF